MLLGALVIAAAASAAPVFWEIRPATPPPVAGRPAIPPDLIRAAARFEGCYDLTLPTELSSAIPETLRVYLSRVPASHPGRFEAFFQPPSPLRTTWTIHDQVAHLTWSTGESGVSFGLASLNGALSAEATAFSDNLTTTARPLVAIRATEIECPAELLAGPEMRSREQRIVACAVLLNIEKRREARLAMELPPDSPWIQAEVDRLRAATRSSVTDIGRMFEECYPGSSDPQQTCREQVATVHYSALPLVLAPELAPQPPAPPGYCPAAPWFGFFFGTVTEKGAFIQPEALSTVVPAVPPAVLAQMARALEDSLWIPALRCGAPVDARVQGTVRRFSPCDQF